MSEDPSFVSLLLSFPYQRHSVVDQSILHFHREGRQNILDLLLVLNLLPEFGLNDLPLDISLNKEKNVKTIPLISGPGFTFFPRWTGTLHRKYLLPGGS